MVAIFSGNFDSGVRDDSNWNAFTTGTELRTSGSGGGGFRKFGIAKLCYIPEKGVQEIWYW